jgi:hypothetical protein
MVGEAGGRRQVAKANHKSQIIAVRGKVESSHESLCPTEI